MNYVVVRLKINSTKVFILLIFLNASGVLYLDCYLSYLKLMMSYKLHSSLCVDYISLTVRKVDVYVKQNEDVSKYSNFKFWYYNLDCLVGLVVASLTVEQEVLVSIPGGRKKCYWALPSGIFQ